MAIQKFEDIIAWQKSQDYAVGIYSIFSGLKDYSFKDQVSRAVVSISSNIAEGFDRQTNKEFIRFLYISLGSCSEVKSLLYLAFRLKYISEETRNAWLEIGNEISRILRGLIQSMQKKSLPYSRKKGLIWQSSVKKKEEDFFLPP